MLNPLEAARIQEKFSVSNEQIRLDHAISHVLSALKNIESEFVFYGGTALARTYLTSGRLSEDIDIYSDNRDLLILEFERLPEWIEQEFPKANWVVSPSATKDPEGCTVKLRPSHASKDPDC